MPYTYIDRHGVEHTVADISAIMRLLEEQEIGATTLVRSGPEEPWLFAEKQPDILAAALMRLSETSNNAASAPEPGAGHGPSTRAAPDAVAPISSNLHLPSNVRYFERLMYVALGLGGIGGAILYGDTTNVLMAQALALWGVAGTRIFIVTLWIFLFAYYWLSIWLIVYRRKNWVRWTWLVLLCISLPFSFVTLHREWTSTPLAGLFETASWVVVIAAFYFIFSGNARAWFRDPLPLRPLSLESFAESAPWMIGAFFPGIALTLFLWSSVGGANDASPTSAPGVVGTGPGQMLPWSDVATKPAFRSLSDSEKAVARVQYCATLANRLLGRGAGEVTFGDYREQISCTEGR